MYENQPLMLKQLAARGADLNIGSVHNDIRTPPIHTAIVFRRRMCLKILIQGGCDIEAGTRWGTPLCSAMTTDAYVSSPTISSVFYSMRPSSRVLTRFYDQTDSLTAPSAVEILIRAGANVNVEQNIFFSAILFSYRVFTPPRGGWRR